MCGEDPNIYKKKKELPEDAVKSTDNIFRALEIALRVVIAVSSFESCYIRSRRV